MNEELSNPDGLLNQGTGTLKIHQEEDYIEKIAPDL